MVSKSDDSKVVSVSEKGQATIPKRLRDEHGITAPGKVRFVENEDGEIVVEPVPSLREFRGAGSDDTDGTERLRREREEERARDERLSDTRGPE